MEWRKPDDYPESDYDVVIYYKSAINDKERVWIGWYSPDIKRWVAAFDIIETLLAWMPLPPKPNFEKDEKEN